VVIADTHSKPSAARVIAEQGRQRGVPRGVPERGDRHQPDHARGHGEEGAETHPRNHVRLVPGEIARLKADLAAAGTPERRALDEVKPRVTATLAPAYEKPFSIYGEYRPWRTGLLANVERTYAMVS
jgi:hypothetical protein